MTLQDLFLDQLKDIYNAEGQLVKALPKMAKASNSNELRDAFKTHLEQTRVQIDRLKQCFEEAGSKPKGVLCKGMQGLVEEGQEHMEKDAGDVYGDLSIIGSAERVEHYEIAAYETAIGMARTLKMTNAVSLLQENLKEEVATAKLLTQMSKRLLREANDSRPTLEMAGAGR